MTMSAALRRAAPDLPGAPDPAGAARRLLGAGVAVAGGPVAAWAGPLRPEEEEAVARARPARRAEFAAGRAAARAAMALLGHPPAPLPRRADGPPLWPAGLTGSLSPGGGHVLAALAPADLTRALGLDVEPIAPLPPDLAREICRPDEDAGEALRVFGAKEAAYKALFAVAATPLGLAALRVSLGPGGAFAAELMEPAGPLAAGLVLRGGQMAAQGLLISALRIP